MGNVGVFLQANFFCFISKHLKMGPCNDILRAALALSRVGSDASYTDHSPFGGEFFLQSMPLSSTA